MTSTLPPGSVGPGCFPVRLGGCKVKLGVLRLGAHSTTLLHWTVPHWRERAMTFTGHGTICSLEVLQSGSHWSYMAVCSSSSVP